MSRLRLFGQFIGVINWCCDVCSSTICVLFSFFFNDTATTEIYTYGHTLSLHDALPISDPLRGGRLSLARNLAGGHADVAWRSAAGRDVAGPGGACLSRGGKGRCGPL